jgi:hypothetical protein
MARKGLEPAERKSIPIPAWFFVPEACSLLYVFANLFPSALAGQGLFYPALLAWFQVEGVTLYVLNNVFGLNFALEPSKSILQRLALLQSNFCQTHHPQTSLISARLEFTPFGLAFARSLLVSRGSVESTKFVALTLFASEVSDKFRQS